MTQDIQYAQDVKRVSTRARTAFFKLYADDFLTGCRRSGMTPEQVGVYIFMLALEWQDKAPLDDDMRVLSIRTGWDIRTVRRIVNSLVQLRKYEREDGLLQNQRMQEEIEIYVAKVKEKEGKIVLHSPVNEPTLTKHRGDIKPTLTPDLSEKANKNKATTSEKALYARRALEPEPEPYKKVSNPPLPPSQHGAAFENGRLVLFNGTKQFWLEQFGGDEKKLDLALLEAGGYVQPNSSRPLEAQVGAQLARKVRDKLDKDERYAKAVKANKAPTTAEGESKAQRWGRLMREIESEADKGARK